MPIAVTAGLTIVSTVLAVSPLARFGISLLSPHLSPQHMARFRAISSELLRTEIHFYFHDTKGKIGMGRFKANASLAELPIRQITMRDNA